MSIKWVDPSSEDIVIYYHADDKQVWYKEPELYCPYCGNQKTVWRTGVLFLQRFLCAVCGAAFGLVFATIHDTREEDETKLQVLRKEGNYLPKDYAETWDASKKEEQNAKL